MLFNNMRSLTIFKYNSDEYAFKKTQTYDEFLVSFDCGTEVTRKYGINIF